MLCNFIYTSARVRIEVASGLYITPGLKKIWMSNLGCQSEFFQTKSYRPADRIEDIVAECKGFLIEPLMVAFSTKPKYYLYIKTFAMEWEK